VVFLGSFFFPNHFDFDINKTIHKREKNKKPFSVNFNEVSVEDDDGYIMRRNIQILL